MGWFGRMQRRDRGYVRHIMLRVELSGRRKRGRPQRSFMDVVKEDARDGVRWRQMVCHGEHPKAVFFLKKKTSWAVGKIIKKTRQENANKN